jgi:hypothetical protein
MIQHTLVPLKQSPELTRHSNGGEKIGRGQQQILLFAQPQLGAIMLTFRTMSIAAGVIAIMELAAFGALPGLSAESRGTAFDNMLHCLAMTRQKA